MLWILVVALIIIWLIAVLALKVAGSIIHLLLVVALVMLVINLLRSRKTV